MGDKPINRKVCSNSKTIQKLVRLGLFAVGAVARALIGAPAPVDSDLNISLEGEKFAQEHQMSRTPNSLVVSTVVGTKVVSIKQMLLWLLLRDKIRQNEP